MYLLTNPVKDYPWGSRTDLAGLTGRPVPSPGPEAEMWLGAHPSGSSVLAEEGQSLADAVAADPAGMLGEAALGRFGERLPYLMKLIAVEAPLSLQVHPSAAQAADGHGRGVYGDPWPKPELIRALTPFTALAGFRDSEQSAMLIDRLGVRGLKDVVALLSAGSPLEALAALLAAGDVAEQAGWSASAVHQPDYALVARLARQYPGDPACLAPLLLQRHELEPGQALFLEAGVLHCYLRGFGVEIMGSSDNVMRAGLTSKPLNVPELLHITDPARVPHPLEAGADGVYATSAEEFRLRQLTGGEWRLADGSPRIVLCTDGSVTVGGRRLVAGESVFLPAADGDVVAHANGLAFCAEPAL
ncbi:mannose-6-phosphate isomerase, class I [Nonomuraea sp. NPDC049725]|uniref:mannose-6-phosphate isomerase, class I n=1 Tax=Nonomuraea sp. NPDC049725 TaxID=3154508 RepID=UPI003423F024